MAQNARVEEPARIGGRRIGNRLSPAEAHGVLRQQLEQLATPWGFKPGDVHRLTQQRHLHIYDPGEIIVPQGAHADCLGLIVRGQVAVHRGERRVAHTPVILLPGSTFGEAMLTEGRPSHATLQALTRCEIWFLLRADFRSLADERRAERQVATLWRLVALAAGLLTVILAAILVLSLPSTRRLVALGPMALGQWCQQQDLGGCAEQAWTVAANLAPEDDNPLLALGALSFERGELGRAEQLFEAARALAPDSPEVHNNLGLIHARQGDHGRAIAAFQEALALEPGVAAVEHNLGISLQALHAYDEALLHYRAALALGEPRASTLVNMAVAYFETGQPDRAVNAAREALLQDEGSAPAYTVLGAVALESEQPEDAIAHLHRAIGLDSSYSQAYFYLGLAYKSLDRPLEAISAFEQALTTASDGVMRVRIRRHLNELYQLEGQERSP
jgi:tetratricopeptide (TPR) repeat protein